MIVLAVLAIHIVSLILPYYFVDDVWLYRRPEPGFPDRYGVVAVLQGRPVMAALNLGVQVLRARLGIQAMLIIRSVATAAMMAFAYCVYRFLRLWQSPSVALCLSVLLVTLPSFQMYVSAAPIFAPSLAYCGLVVLMFGRFVFREESSAGDWIVLILTTIGLVFIWATYQAIPLVVIGLLTPLLISGEMESSCRRKALAVFLLSVGVSLVLYYGAWRASNLGVPSDGRYSPRFDGFYLVGNWSLYRTLRVPQIFSFWDTRPESHVYLYESAALVAAACALDLFRAGSRWVSRAMMWALGIAAIVAVDVPILLAPPSNTLSYMTSAPGATAVFMLVAISVVMLSRELIVRVPRLQALAKNAAVMVCVVGVLLAARSVALSHVVPNWLEYALVRSEIRQSLAEGHKISSVTVYTRSNLLSGARSEFQWSNFSGSFWAHWAVREILDELGQNSHIRVDVRNSDDSAGTLIESAKAGPLFPPGPDRHLVIDLRTLDLSEPPGSSFREPSPLSQIDPPPPPPEGLRALPIDEIHSTLTFANLGAKGERAVIDGNLRTPAADPGGLNSSTVIALQLKSVDAVAGLRIFKSEAYGVSKPVTLSVSCDDNGRQRTLGTIDVRPGTDGFDEASWAPSCRTRTIRIVPAPGFAGGDFWISEIQLFGTSSQPSSK